VVCASILILPWQTLIFLFIV